jgi:E3 ubiquitin-protein ligase UBR2
MQERDAQERCSLLEAVCRHDTVLWKAARSQLHHLLMAGMIWENESKRQFATVFTKCYGAMMKDFILDDHEHSFSITSLSVQLFTVPTLAHYLIANKDVLATLFNTFMSECKPKRNDRGKLEFQRNSSLPGFRRAYFILNDLKYLLTTPPDNDTTSGGLAWNDDLRKGFLHGLKFLIEILLWMQGMDQQQRMLTQHVEFEMEWETAFTLHIRLAPVITLFASWCGTDRVILVKAVRMIWREIFKEARESEAAGYPITHTVHDKSAQCIHYSVSAKPVSMHLPLTRLLAALCLHLGKFELTLEASVFDIPERPLMVEQVEPVLRTTVLVSQVHAGMWRRNGYSMTDQARVYRDPRCRTQMLDQDVIMLQVAAANMPPDDFLINLLAKYQLVDWTSIDFDCSEDDSIRQITTLVEECLNVVIMVLGERYTPGIGRVTPMEAIRKEVIQLLCVENMSNSSLTRAISEDVVNRESSLEKVMQAVAVFKKQPAGTGRATYELKPEFYDEYDVFYYHYNKEEQSKSEQNMRKRRKDAGQPVCNPPPPQPAFTREFEKILSIIESEVFLHCIALVLRRADNLKSRCFSENQVHSALHIIGHCLNEEERSKAAAGSEIGAKVNFTEKAEKYELLELLQQLVGSQRIESHMELLQWVLNKFRKLAGKEIDESAASCSASTSAPTEESMSEADTERKAKADVASARRDAMIAKMKKAQNKFMNENLKVGFLMNILVFAIGPIFFFLASLCSNHPSIII